MTQAEQIEELKYLLIQALPADSGFTPPPQCMPDEYKQVDTVQAYRAYYTQAKRDLLTYTNRATPEWAISV